MTITTEKRLDELKAEVLDERELLALAYMDAAAELARFAVLNRPIPDAITVLETWRAIFERNTQMRSRTS